MPHSPARLRWSKRVITSLAFTLALLALIADHGAAQSRFVGIADLSVTGTDTLIRAASGSRTALVCTNTSATVHLRLGGSGVTTTSGVQLRAASTITLTGPYDVYGVSEGAAVTVACSEELR